MAITATYRNGTFIPDFPVGLPEGTHVEVWLPGEVERAEAVRAVLKAKYPDSIGAFTQEEAEGLRCSIAELRLMDDERDQ